MLFTKSAICAITALITLAYAVPIENINPQLSGRDVSTHHNATGTTQAVGAVEHAGAVKGTATTTTDSAAPAASNVPAASTVDPEIAKVDLKEQPDKIFEVVTGRGQYMKLVGGQINKQKITSARCFWNTKVQPERLTRVIVKTANKKAWTIKRSPDGKVTIVKGARRPRKSTVLKSNAVAGKSTETHTKAAVKGPDAAKGAESPGLGTAAETGKTTGQTKV